ncbi:hypothetical protein [Vibrio sp.]|uniref:hypothetical protein n=1 Tax=Vibrio sp. TaxID=678 RepID=UPI003D12CAC6
MEINWVEWFGYLASLVVLISLTMSSIVKLRVINFIGCLLFAAFAWLINSYPTMLMNLGIAGINVYYLNKILSTKEEFKLIPATLGSEYYQHFIATNRQDIAKQATEQQLAEADTAFYILRNNSLAGVLVGKMAQEGVMEVILDYVTQEYRDFKIGRYCFERHPEVMQNRGIHTLHAWSSDPSHRHYLQTVGFTPSQADPNHFIKHLQTS